MALHDTRNTWRSFFVDVPLTESCVLAQFDPDASKAQLIVITQSKRVRWYDVRALKISQLPVRELSPAVAPGQLDVVSSESIATTALLFDPPLPVVDGPTQPAPLGQLSADAAKNVRFDGAVSPSSHPNAVPPPPVGAIANSEGGVDIFTELGFSTGFRLNSRAPIIRMSVVDRLVLLGGTDDGSNESEPHSPVSVDHAPGGPATVRLSRGKPISSFTSNDVELRTSHAPFWIFTLAVLDAEGTIAVLRPQGPASAPGMLRTLHKPVTSVVRTMGLCACGEGVLYHAGPRGSRRIIMRVPVTDAEKSSGHQPPAVEELRLPVTSIRAVRSMDCFRHLVVCCRGSEAFLVDYLTKTTSRLVDLDESIHLVHMAYPAVVLGGVRGGIYVVNMLSSRVLAATATFNNTPARSLRYCWQRGLLVVTDQTGAIELLEAPDSVKQWIRGPLSTLATGRVLRRTVELEAAPPHRKAKVAETVVLERITVPDEVALYMGRQVRLP